MVGLALPQTGIGFFGRVADDHHREVSERRFTPHDVEQRSAVFEDRAVEDERVGALVNQDFADLARVAGRNHVVPAIAEREGFGDETRLLLAGRHLIDPEKAAEFADAVGDIYGQPGAEKALNQLLATRKGGRVSIPGVYGGWRVPSTYDALIAKVITHGSSRAEAIAKMRCALDEFIIGGIRTNIPLHQALLRDPEVIEGRMSTRTIERVVARGF